MITEKGYENFTHFLPMELDDIEAVVRETGIVQTLPPALSGVFKRAPVGCRQERQAAEAALSLTRLP